MANSYIKQLDPIQGLIDYVNDIKPYHSKVIEVMIEYVYDDVVNMRVDDAIQFTWGPSEAKLTVNSSGTLAVVSGDWTNAFLSFPETVSIKLIAPNGDVTYVQRQALNAVWLNGSNETAVTLDAPLPAFIANKDKLVILGDVVRYFGPYTVVNIQQQKITVSGSATADICSGQRVVYDSLSANAGTYTVTGNPVFDGVNTILEVAEPIVDEMGNGAIVPERYFVP